MMLEPTYMGVCPNCLQTITNHGKDQHHLSLTLDYDKKETVVRITCHWLDKSGEKTNE